MTINRLFKAVADASFELLSESRLEYSLPKALQCVADAAQIDRIQIFQYTNPTLKFPYTLLNDWCTHASDIEWQKSGFNWLVQEFWHKALQDRETIRWQAPNEEHLLKSVMLIPLFFQNHYWGFMSFETVRLAKEWSEEEVQIINTFSANIAVQINNNHSERVLKESEERYKNLIEHAPVAIIVHIKGEIVYANPEAARFIHASSVSEIIGKNVLHFVPKEDHPMIIERMTQIATSNQAGEKIHERFLKPNGEIIEAEVTAIPFVFEGKRAIQVIANNITKQKKALKTIEENEERFRMVLEKTGQVVYDYDVQSRAIKWSGAIEEVTGYTPEEFNTFTVAEWAEMIHPSDRQKTMELLQAAEDNCVSFSAVYRFMRKDGSYIVIDDEGIFVKHPLLPKSERLLGVMKNITAIKQSEEELQRINKHLKKVNDELEQFAYITSHNLRAPIVNLSSLVALFDRQNMSEPHNLQYLDKIDQSVKRLESTLNDLVQIVSERKPNPQANSTKLSFNQLVDEICQSIENQFKDTSISLRCDFASVPSIHQIDVHLRSVLLNLLTNAIKYRKRDQNLHIDIKTQKTDEYVCLSVSDNGIGMDLEKMGHKLFGLYQRFSEESEGKGMGLYIIKNQIESTGGYITVDSQPGQGSTFTVYMKDLKESYETV
ncbi:PAS domain S-box protein [Cytophagales bacterium LB-30]|uniref:histidine kinase n=1 Tax=Shiella aurantiaca TaxID=3058365 RepID=A0ABT8F4M2_9BACT|nr:PAS domain S-box protein [Shiella aurantiaca]MDN4165405.1 PAS domain S-box protein [Shiella aurantiaca]